MLKAVIYKYYFSNLDHLNTYIVFAIICTGFYTIRSSTSPVLSIDNKMCTK